MGPLAGKNTQVKIGYLLLFVDERGREIHDSANLTADQANDLEENLKVFENYTKPRKNALRASFKFDRRRQQENESFDDCDRPQNPDT